MAREELSTREIDALITQIERRVDMLKKEYERYFIGLDRRPPMPLHHQVVREVLELDQMHINNTAQKFRARGVIQRFNTLKTYWNRTLRQIEDGTYHRDRSRADRRDARRREREEAREQEAYEIDLEADLLDLEEIDLEAVFSDSREPQMGSQPRPSEPGPSQPSSGPAEMGEAEKERVRLERLAEIQRQLGIGGPGPQPAQPAQPARPAQPAQPARPAQPAQPARPADSELSAREQKLAAMRARLQTKSTASAPAAQSSSGVEGGASSSESRSAKLSRLKGSLQRDEGVPAGARTSGSQRVVSRSSVPAASQSGSTSSARTVARPAQSGSTGSRGTNRVVSRASSSGSDDDAARRVYQNLLEAKRRCNESTDRLSYDAVKRSMDKQRASLEQKGSRNVDFQVVIKDGKAFLKPESKD